MHWFPTGSSLPPPYRAPGVGHLSTLPRRRRDGRASGVPVPGPRSRQDGYLARRQLYNRSATPLQLPGMDWGGDPPPDREWERQREIVITNVIVSALSTAMRLILHDDDCLKLQKQISLERCMKGLCRMHVPDVGRNMVADTWTTNTESAFSKQQQ